ncbi:MAG: hypothetical protein WCG27_00885 [Pseudomonadota bacterium]
MNKVFIALLLATLIPGISFAKMFANHFCEFQLPSGWECALEGTEWVCQSEDANRKKEAIIILAAKYRGAQDSLEAYQTYLKDTKAFSLPGGKTQVSEPKYTKFATINTHRWVDALHLASEVPGFYTRYLATVKEDLGLAVTFSVSKDHYDSYQDVFEKVVQTLRVFREAPKAQNDFKLTKKDENLLDDTTFVPNDPSKTDIGQRDKKKGGLGGMSDSETFFLIIILAVIGFVVYRKFKAKK